MAILRNINVLIERKWQSLWDEADNNKLHEIHPQLCLLPGGFRITRREESVFSKIRNYSQSLNSLLPFEKGRSSTIDSL